MPQLLTASSFPPTVDKPTASPAARPLARRVHAAGQMLSRLEQIAGAILILIVLADVFLTVLYARVGTGVLSARLARIQWRVFRAIAWRSGRHRGKVLSFCAPTVLVSLVGVWASLLAVGAALIIHPALGNAVRASTEPTPHDFMTALFAGASSLAFVGVGDFSPHTTAYKLLYLFDSMVGISVMSLTLTYLMQVYIGLRERNTFCLKMHLLSGQTDDAAEMLAGFAVRGKFDATYSAMAEMAAESVQVKEVHHFYPVLAIFRFREPYYAMCSVILKGLDFVTLVKSALDDDEFGWVKESAAITQLWRALLLSTKLLDEAQHHEGDATHGEEPDDATRERWRRRYLAAVRRLKEAGIRTYPDEAVGAEIYVSLRAQWDHRIAVLAPAMAYTMKEIDPAGHDPKTTEQLPGFERRLSAVE